MSFREIAEPLAKMGIRITPVKPGTKEAFLPGFQNTATADLDQIHAWDEQYPDYNAACVAPPIPKEGDVYFWEVDSPKEGSPDVLTRIENATGYDVQAEIKTFKVRSRPGRGHFYFRHTASTLSLPNLSQTYVVGQDWSLRVKGQYVVAPGSAHPDTGKPYEALNWETPIAEAPQWLIDWWLSQRVKKNETAEKREAPRNENGLVPHGAIHGYLLTQAGKLRQMGLDFEELDLALKAIADKNCQPPLDYSKIEKMAKSVCDLYEVGSPSYNISVGGNPTTNAYPNAAQVQITSELLEQEFPAYDGSQPPEVPMLIKGFMPKGTSFLGSLSGIGKTWFALAVAKSLTTGEPLWGVFDVPEKVAVLYLIPEASKQSFCYRLSKMGIVQDKTLFRYRTISEGVTQPLNGQLVYAMVKELALKRDVLIVVDTAVRFLRADDENSSMENTLMKDTELLGSITKETGTTVSFLFQHHSPKASKDAAELTLENVLRGTGDFGAMADCVYGLRRDEGLYAGGEGPEEMEVVCVKPRNVHPQPLPFRLALSRRPKKDEVVEDDRPTVSYIDTTGNLYHIGNAGVKDAVIAKAVALVKENPEIAFNTVVKETKMNRGVLKELLASRGYTQKPHIVNGKKKFRWSNSLIMMAAPGVQEPGPNTVSFERKPEPDPEPETVSPHGDPSRLP